VKLLAGFDSKIIPMLDSHEQALAGLPKQIEESFAKQTESMKGYVERRLNPVDEKGNPAPDATKAQPSKGSGFDFQKLFDWADKQITQAGGVKSLLAGNSAPVDGELAVLTRELEGLEKLRIRNVLRKDLNLLKEGLGIAEEVATGPVKVQAP
jgi:hypothetical protein